MSDWKDLGNKAKNITLAGIGKAKDLGESAKLNLDNLSEEENRKRILAEIGQKFVEATPEAPEGFEELYAKLAECQGKIDANKDRLEKL